MDGLTLTRLYGEIWLAYLIGDGRASPPLHTQFAAAGWITAL